MLNRIFGTTSHQFIIVFFIVFAVSLGCEDNEKLKSVTGVVQDVQIVQEDSSVSYVVFHFEDKIVKLRTSYDSYLEVPKHKLITVFYDRLLYVQSIEDLTRPEVNSELK